MTDCKVYSGPGRDAVSWERFGTPKEQHPGLFSGFTCMHTCTHIRTHTYIQRNCSCERQTAIAAMKGHLGVAEGIDGSWAMAM